MQQKIKISRKEQAVQTKSKIYASAEQLFSKYGVDSVNVDDIVKHAGVAKGSFYVHFESKDVLIAMLINDYVNKADTDYKTYLESLPSDMVPHDVVLSLVGKIADVLTDIIGCENMRILYRIQLGKDNKTNALIDYNRELYKIVYDVIANGINQKAFLPSFSAEEIAKQFVVSYRGLTFEWCIRYPDFNLKEEALRHFEILLAGISHSK
ncbi:MAG: TetR/AcrR family transcriptional regulator [Eubacteriales bacterium]|nr:TetR/AcrR family transcriptional regulator [Eubacteriales bacterium]MDD4476435.1 TetR/AcrR family transcriptional regulator [Eubacteriales bacterium]